MDKLRNPKVLGAFRHLLSTLGGVLAAQGIVTATMWETYTGLGFALLALLLSVTASEKSS